MTIGFLHFFDQTRRIILVEMNDFRALFLSHREAILNRIYAITLPTTIRSALAMANCPTGPQPNTATIAIQTGCPPHSCPGCPLPFCCPVSSCC